MIRAEILPNNVLTCIDHTVSDSINFETIGFVFPATWQGYTKTALFKYGDQKAVSIVLDALNPLCVNDSTCYIPFEVLNAPGFTVSVTGCLGDSLATTTCAYVSVLQSGKEEGVDPQEPTPDQYSQIINLATETKEIALSLRTDAQNGVFNGKKGDQGPQGEKGEKGDKGDGADTSLLACAIQNNVSGSVVLAKDVSALPHKVKVQLSGNEVENLLPSTPYAEPLGISYKNGDGSFTINGMPSDTLLPIIVFHSGGNDLAPIEEGTYTLDLGVATTQVYLQIGLNIFDYSSQKTYQTDATGKVTFTVSAEDYMESLTLRATNSIAIDNLLIKPSLTKADGAASTDFTKVKLYRYGLNSSIDKIEYTPNADGTVEVDSLSPYMSLVTDKCGLSINATYNVDTKSYVDANKGSENGVVGENGATFIPSVSAEGVISWTNDKGLENPAPVNIKGENGETYTLTEADKTAIAGAVKSSLATETWVFELEDGTTVEKAVLLG